MKHAKTLITAALTGALAVGCVTGALATNGSITKELFYQDIKITLNGNPIIPRDAQGNTVEPFTIDGTTYLPVRGIADALGLGVEWDGNTNTVILTGGAGSLLSEVNSVYRISQSYEYNDATIGDFYIHINDGVEITDTSRGKAVSVSFTGTNISGKVTSINQSVKFRAFQKSILLRDANTDPSAWVSSRLGGEVTVTYSFYVNDLESPIEFEVYDAHNGGSQIAKATFVRT